MAGTCCDTSFVLLFEKQLYRKKNNLWCFRRILLIAYYSAAPLVFFCVQYKKGDLYKCPSRSPSRVSAKVLSFCCSSKCKRTRLKDLFSGQIIRILKFKIKHGYKNFFQNFLININNPWTIIRPIYTKMIQPTTWKYFNWNLHRLAPPKRRNKTGNLVLWQSVLA